MELYNILDQQGRLVAQVRSVVISNMLLPALESGAWVRENNCFTVREECGVSWSGSAPVVIRIPFYPGYRIVPAGLQLPVEEVDRTKKDAKVDDPERADEYLVNLNSEQNRIKVGDVVGCINFTGSFMVMRIERTTWPRPSPNDKLTLRPLRKTSLVYKVATRGKFPVVERRRCWIKHPCEL